MKYKLVHAIFCSNSTADFLNGWGYDLEVYEKDGLVILRQPNIANSERTLTSAEYRSTWSIVRNFRDRNSNDLDSLGI